MHRGFDWRWVPLSAVLLAGLTVPGDGGSAYRCLPDPDEPLFADGALHVDPDFELEPPTFRAAVLLHRHSLDPRAVDVQLDFAYLEAVDSAASSPVR